MDKIKLIPCIVCEVPWPKQALDKLGVCPICYKGGGSIPPLIEDRW
mgnify:FL=1